MSFDSSLDFLFHHTVTFQAFAYLLVVLSRIYISLLMLFLIRECWFDENDQIVRIRTALMTIVVMGYTWYVAQHSVQTDLIDVGKLVAIFSLAGILHFALYLTYKRRTQLEQLIKKYKETINGTSDINE